MKVGILVYQPPTEFAMRSGKDAKEYWSRRAAFGRALQEAGAFVSGVGLEGGGQARTTRIEKGNLRVQDGPYADTKEQLGGLFLIDVPSIPVALKIAKLCPAPVVEVRPVLVGL